MQDSLPMSDDRGGFAAWEELGAGAPTVIAFARLASQALGGDASPELPLSLEARAILFAARQQGILEIRGAYAAFEAPARLLAVCVVQEDERFLDLKSRQDPELTVRFLDGFRELCRGGLVMHHLFREFSLTRRGFERARSVSAEEVMPLLRQFRDPQGQPLSEPLFHGSEHDEPSLPLDPDAGESRG